MVRRRLPLSTLGPLRELRHRWTSVLAPYFHRATMTQRLNWHWPGVAERVAGHVDTAGKEAVVILAAVEAAAASHVVLLQGQAAAHGETHSTRPVKLSL